jgi:predicted RNA-binding Zn-ribbon protein involved in translation (DUF1610 family)
LPPDRRFAAFGVLLSGIVTRATAVPWTCPRCGRDQVSLFPDAKAGDDLQTACTKCGFEKTVTYPRFSKSWKFKETAPAS